MKACARSEREKLQEKKSRDVVLLELVSDFTFMSLDFKSLPMSVCRIIKIS